MFNYQPSQLLALWIVASLTGVTLWDVSILAFGIESPTVSWFIYDMGRKFPLLYLWLGIAIGHLLMPLVVRNGGL